MAERFRRRRLGLDKEVLVARAKRFVEDDESSRTSDMWARTQRYAKFRQWTGARTGAVWDESSNVALPDLASKSLRIQDTLYNAALARRPTIIAKATGEKDKEKEDTVNAVLDYQAYVENGEVWLAELIDAFVNDGHFTAFIPWVRDKKQATELRIAPPLPDEEMPGVFFKRVLETRYPDAVAIQASRRGGVDPLEAWDFKVTLPDEDLIRVAFYADSEGAPVEMAITRQVVVFDGPKIMVKDREDILHPPGVANLQPPSPSNPKGAAHVVVVDRPEFGEILRLKRDKFYDLLSAEQVDTIRAGLGKDVEYSKEASQRATMAGEDLDSRMPDPVEHKQVERHLVFDMMPLREGGPVEDVVYWVLPQFDVVLRQRRLSEAFPHSKVARPFAEEQFFPVRGQRTGIGSLEFSEALHDVKKVVLDQAMDLGTLQLSPFFFYRPTSSMKQEVIRLWPGEGYPLSDPRNDISFPALPNQGHAFAFNVFSLLDREDQRLSMIGDLQLGRVPQGQASALRTARGIAMIGGQGDSRPERILRRFFHGLAQIWSIMHELNRHFMPAEKQIRITTPLNPNDDPYKTIEKDDIDTVFEFEFEANAFNTSRDTQLEALQALTELYISPIGLQSGIVTAEKGIFNLFQDLGKLLGVDHERYLTPPLGMPFITAEEAMGDIMIGKVPNGLPIEGAQMHLQKIMAFAESEEFGFLEEEGVEAFAEWVQMLEGLMKVEQQQQALGAAAGEGQQGQGGGPEGRPPVGGPLPEAAPVGDNQLVDETLPGAGGGANRGA